MFTATEQISIKRQKREKTVSLKHVSYKKSLQSVQVHACVFTEIQAIRLNT